MRILFLQKVDNAKGGIANVNENLMKYFLSQNCQVDVLSLRHGYTWEDVSYPEGVNRYLVNDSEVWGLPRLYEILEEVKCGHFFKAFHMWAQRGSYKRRLAKDYEQCQKEIERIQPDVIINSHYELLDGISETYLKKTIMHFHTSFGQVKGNRSYIKTFQKYQSQISTFVWLTEQTKKEAIEFGFQNSKCIYNPISFSETRSADLKRKKVIFIGRLSEEKRIPLAIECFREVVHENKLDDWMFEIYGSGPLVDKIMEEIKNDKQVQYKGQTDEVNEVLLDSSLLILTSAFEGMPLVVLEANECGVPSLIYDFGESSREVVVDGVTGIIVPQDNKELFKANLKEMMCETEIREKYGPACKKFAKEFALETIGKKWIELFEEMEK